MFSDKLLQLQQSQFFSVDEMDHITEAPAPLCSAVMEDLASHKPSGGACVPVACANAPAQMVQVLPTRTMVSDHTAYNQRIPATGRSKRKAEHMNSRAVRRGPMDEMRQLVRILSKLMPGSDIYLKRNGENLSNKITEDQIRCFLSLSLGEAPQPEWGLPDGWGHYVANLFNWARGGCYVSADAARKCASRETGKPWSIDWSEVHSLGVYPECWPLPLTLSEVQQVQATDDKFNGGLSHSGNAPGCAPEDPDMTINKRQRCSHAEGIVSASPSPHVQSETARLNGLSADALLDTMLVAAEALQRLPAHLRGDASKQCQTMNAVANALPAQAKNFPVTQMNTSRHEVLLNSVDALVRELENRRRTEAAHDQAVPNNATTSEANMRGIPAPEEEEGANDTSEIPHLDVTCELDAHVKSREIANRSTPCEDANMLSVRESSDTESMSHEDPMDMTESLVQFFVSLQESQGNQVQGLSMPCTHGLSQVLSQTFSFGGSQPCFV